MFLGYLSSLGFTNRHSVCEWHLGKVPPQALYFLRCFFTVGRRSDEPVCGKLKYFAPTRLRGVLLSVPCAYDVQPDRRFIADSLR